MHGFPGVDPGFFNGGGWGGGRGEVDDNNWPSNYFKFSGAAPEVLSCPTFVPKRGDLGKTKAGWRHKVFATHAFLYFFGPHIFPFVFPRIIFFRWAVLKGGWLATQFTPPRIRLRCLLLLLRPIFINRNKICLINSGFAK